MEFGGSAPAAKVIDAVSDRLGVPNEVRNDYREVDCGKWGVRRRCAWRQKIHWVRQNAIYAGLIENSASGIWTLSDRGRGSLNNCQPGVILTIYETPSGEAVWCDAMTASGALETNSINLLFSSPAYPLAGKGRAYGNISPGETVEMIVKCAKEWRRAMKDDASIVLNFRDVWLPKAETGGAVRSLYQEKLLLALVEDVGLYFADRLFWKNPGHMPDSPWVTIRRVRTNMDVEQLFWLSKSPNPKADNRRILVDAKPETIASYLRKSKRGQKRVIGPSGQGNCFEEQMAAVAAGQTLKVIPRNLVEFANTDPRVKLHAKLKDLGLPKHDAVMPRGLAEHVIKFLTEPGDTVVDLFNGSGTVCAAAESLGRRWIGGDRSLAHVLSSALRFNPESLRYT